MELKTKLNPNDKAFVLSKGKIVHVNIEQIGIGIYKNNRTYINYGTQPVDGSSKRTEWFEEKLIFKTKKELTQSLIYKK